MRTQNIIVEFAGGLGNQLFQYAFAQVLFIELQNHGDSSVVYKIWLDGTGVKRDVKRRFHILSMLKEHSAISKSSVIRSRRKLFSLVGERIHISLSKWEKVIHKIHPYIPLSNAQNYLFLSEESCCLKTREKNLEIIPTLIDTIYKSVLPVFVQGYWQHSHIIKILLNNPNRDLLQIPQDTRAFTHACNFIQGCQRSVSLHVRRTDYLDANAEYPPCTLKYYQNAIAYLHRMHSSQKDKGKMCILIFSDDVVWCKDFLIPVLQKNDKSNLYKLASDISTGALSDIHELILMSLCTHHVLANSSFSWWGSGMIHDVFLPHLKRKNDGIVVAPQQWHRDLYKTQCIPMPHWVLL